MRRDWFVDHVRGIEKVKGEQEDVQNEDFSDLEVVPPTSPADSSPDECPGNSIGRSIEEALTGFVEAMIKQEPQE